MANCHNLFTTYNSEITISTSKKEKLIKSKNALRERIRKRFKEFHPTYDPKFYIQGSYKMKTMIRTKDDICDLDDGVYFFREPDVSSTTLQKWVLEAVYGHTSTPPEHRKKCIRNTFVNDYEIDLPIYYLDKNGKYQIAIKNEGWREDDPKGMVDWFAKKKANGAYLVNVVKYLKAWCDFKRHSMPCGLAMTILAAEAKDKIATNVRDDIYLKDTLNEIRKTLRANFTCMVPVAPFDNLFSCYSQDQKDKFVAALDSFFEAADQAIREPNQLKASKLWRNHLGDRFPLGEDKTEVTSNQNLIAGIGLSRPYAN